MIAYVTSPAHRFVPWLGDLLPSLGAHLGVGGFEEDAIGLPAASRYVVVLVDGLGWDNTVRGCMDAPYVAEVLGDAIRADVRLPATTAASLMSLWTGVVPGRHGVVGYSFALPQAGRLGRVVTPLGLPEPLETPPSVPDRLAAAGVAVSFVLPADLVASGFTRMGTRGRVVGVPVRADRETAVSAIVAASRADRALVYAYDGRLDHAGHKYGVDSPQWRATLGDIDALLGTLRSRLDDDVRLIVTGDHGMIDVGVTDRIVIDNVPELSAGVRLIGGEARFRHLYVAQPAAVAARWRAHLGEAAEVLTRDEAIDQGLFGPVAPGVRERIGDVVVYPRAGQAYLTDQFPGEFTMVGMHGAATPGERYVPLLVD